MSGMTQQLAYYTTTEVAERAHVDPSTVRVWVATGKLASVSTLGGHHRFERDLIDSLFPPAPAVSSSPDETTGAIRRTRGDAA